MRAVNDQYRAAERQLMDAIRAGEVCDFADGAEITAEEMASWGPERTIRATLLRRLLTAEDAQYAKVGVRLRGAAVEGVLDLQGVNVMNLDLTQCRLTTAKASGATFTGDASFTGATFTGDASLTGATFTGYALFTGATFTGTAQFTGATFTGTARFDSATFTNYAWFLGATFTGDATFDSATFTGNTWFNDATFTGDAWFNDATFTGYVTFDGATFTGVTSFYRATFTGIAKFDSATFTGIARFDSATFTGIARFGGAIADAYDFSRAQFHTTDPGPWIARQVTLAGAVFHVRARLAVAAANTYCRRLQAREGVHLVVRGGAVDLEDAEFLRRSILEHSGSELTLPKRNDPGKRPEGCDDFTPAEQAQWIAKEKAFQLAKNLTDELGSQQVPQTRVVSLRRATAGDLVLSGVGLEDCAFAGAHGLDNLRIGATCSFQRPPTWPSRTWRLFTVRQVIFEEAQWRQAHTRGWASTSTTPTTSAKPNDPLPTALEIAGIYRDLRKGLEDAKDEPGAADFYYGEMEMRRLTAQGRRHQRSGRPKGRFAVADRAQAAGCLLGRLGVWAAGLACGDRADHPAGRMRCPVHPAGLRASAGAPAAGGITRILEVLTPLTTQLSQSAARELIAQAEREMTARGRNPDGRFAVSSRAAISNAQHLALTQQHTRAMAETRNHPSQLSTETPRLDAHQVA